MKARASSRRWLVSCVVAWTAALGVAALVACNRARDDAKGRASAAASSANASRKPVSSNEPLPAPGTVPSAPAPRPLETPQQVLTEWTRALNEADIAALERVYADKVKFYGQSLSREEVLKRKRTALAAAKTFKQSILDDPSIEDKGEVVRIAFRKRSGAKDAQNDVLATLVLRKSPQLLIQEETDAATQKRFSQATAPATPPTDCPMAVWFLADSTREAGRLYRQIDENLKDFPKEADLHPGGMGPFMPNETGDGTYLVSIGVHHPERFESYAWFTIDSTGKVTVSAYTLKIYEDTPTTPSKEALEHFKRLCPVP